MQINTGDIYWIDVGEQIKHPHVVMQIDNDSVIVCSLTTNQNKISMPNVIVLEAGEGNLEKQSIVEVYKTLTVNKSKLIRYIGTLSKQRVEQILNEVELIKRRF